MARPKKITLSKLQETVAKNLVGYIEDQHRFIEKTDKTVTEGLLGGSTSSYDLRQNIQCLETAKSTLNHLLNTFEEHVGCLYDDYCEANKIEPVKTPIDNLTTEVIKLIAVLTKK